MKESTKKSRFRFLIMLLSLLVISVIVFQLSQRGKAKALFQNIDVEKISDISIVIDKTQNHQIMVSQKDLLNQFCENIVDFDWKVSAQKMVAGDSYPIYDFTINGEENTLHMTLIGRQYIFMSDINHKTHKTSEINLQVIWKEGSYDKIIDFVNESKK